MLVADGGRGAGLAGKALAGGAAGRQLRRQHLDGDKAVQDWIKPLEDDTHPPMTDDFQDLVRSEASKAPRLFGRAEEIEDWLACLVVGRGRDVRPGCGDGILRRAGERLLQLRDGTA